MSGLVRRAVAFAALAMLCVAAASAQTAARVIDVPSRPGVTQRFLLLTPVNVKAAVILFAGGNGGLQISDSGAFRWGAGNFLVRSRELFAEQGLMVAVIDTPSDRQTPPYLSGFRQTPEHAADVRAVIAWIKQQANVPVWLVGTSRGTQSAAFVGTELASGSGPDGLVLTSTILNDDRSRAVPDMALSKLAIPALVVHHEQDGCRHCRYRDMPRLMDKLAPLQRKQLLTFTGGENRGDPCEAMAYHGFNGLEPQVVARIAQWIVAR